MVLFIFTSNLWDNLTCPVNFIKSNLSERNDLTKKARNKYSGQETNKSQWGKSVFTHLRHRGKHSVLCFQK